jgi:hypothetical protein
MGINNCDQITQNIPKQYIQNNSINRYDHDQDQDDHDQGDHDQLYSLFDVYQTDTINRDEIPTREQLIMALCILSAIYPCS